MKGYHYVGLDVHKKVIAYCVKRADGKIETEGEIDATRKELCELSRKLPRPCMVGMEAGAQYNKKKLHGKRYFKNLLDELDSVPETVKGLLEMSHASVEYFETCQRKLVDALKEHPTLKQRVERLMSIPGVGEITLLISFPVSISKKGAAIMK